jgi:hypothetical protein
MREEINLDGDTMDLLTTMAEGNPGGLTVMMKLLENDPIVGLAHILHLNDMNIRGTQIWVGYKDHCKSDLQVFIQAIKDRDEAMIDTINKNCIYGDFTEVAVKGQSSF